MKHYRIFLTGGSGFVGTNLIDRLIEKKISIFNIDKFTYSSNKKYQKKRKYYQIKKLDIAKISQKKLIYFFDKFRPTHIIHLAAESHVDKSIKSLKLFINTNIIGTVNILNALKNCKNKKKITLIHVGTDEIYGDLKNKNKKFHSNTPINPQNPYAATKASAIHILKSFYNTFKINYIIVNPSNLFGPFQYPEKFIPRNILLAKNKKNMQLYGKGENRRSWLYIHDFIEALILIIKKGKKSRTYLPGSDKTYSNKTILNYIQKILLIKLKKKIKTTYVKDRLGHDIKYQNNSTDVKNLGWRQKVRILEGLNKTVSWYLNSKNIKLFKNIKLTLMTKIKN